MSLRYYGFDGDPVLDGTDTFDASRPAFASRILSSSDLLSTPTSREMVPFAVSLKGPRIRLFAGRRDRRRR